MVATLATGLHVLALLLSLTAYQRCCRKLRDRLVARSLLDKTVDPLFLRLSKLGCHCAGALLFLHSVETSLLFQQLLFLRKHLLLENVDGGVVVAFLVGFEVWIGVNEAEHGAPVLSVLVSRAGVEIP